MVRYNVDYRDNFGPTASLSGSPDAGFQCLREGCILVLLCPVPFLTCIQASNMHTLRSYGRTKVKAHGLSVSSNCLYIYMCKVECTQTCMAKGMSHVELLSLRSAMLFNRLTHLDASIESAAVTKK